MLYNWLVQRGKPTPTMADVAALAGVSHQTVSRVLNDQPFVSNNARERVNEAIAALGYRRNTAARALVTGSSRIVGMLVTNASMAGPSGASLAIEQMARARGYWVSLAGLQSNDPEENRAAISHFIDQGVEGIIAVAQTQQCVDTTLEASAGMPTVLVTSGVVPAGHPTVDIDQADGIVQLMRHLRALGHTRIAHICGPDGDLHSDVRVAAWRAALPAGQPVDQLLAHGDWSPASGYRAAEALLDGPLPPTAIVSGNDQMAFGVLLALHDRGITVPLDISVVGFDNIAGSDCVIPPLTTIRQNHDALGAAAMTLLLEAMAHGAARCLKVPAELIARASTAPPPALALKAG